MPKLNITQATKEFDVSRRTLQRHMQKGKVAFEVTADGKKFFDPAELARVYEPRKKDGAGDKTSQNGGMAQNDTPDAAPLLVEKNKRINQLEDRVKELENDRTERQERENKLQKHIEEQQQTINKQLLMIAPPEPKPEEQPTASPQPVPNLTPIKKQNWLSKMWNGDREKQRQRVANQTAKTGQDAPIQPASTS